MQQHKLIKVVGQIQKGPREEIRFGIYEDLRGMRYFDVRVWYSVGAGEMRPTPKGLRFRDSKVVGMIHGLQALHRTSGALNQTAESPIESQQAT